MKVKINNRKSFNYIVIIIFSLILSIPLFTKNLNIYNGNGFYSMAKALNFEKNFGFNDGRIMTSFLGYIGTGNLILSAPLATIVLCIFKYFFNSYIISYKVIVVLSLIFSGIYMCKFSERVFKNENIGLLASLLYICAPIHLGQVYVNNSIENILVFVFIPITFLGLYKLFNTTENSFCVSVGIIGLLLTDLKLACIVCIPILVYVVLNTENWRVEHTRKAIIINLIAIISITSFFVFPYIEANLSTDYVMSNKTKSEFVDSTVPVNSLFVTYKTNENIVELGPHIWIMLAFSIMVFKRKIDEEKREYVFAFLCMILCIFASTKLFPWNLMPKWISKIENSYNFLIIASFFECYICAVNMSILLKSFRIRDVLIISIISFLYVGALNGFIPYMDDIKEIDDYDISKVFEYKLLTEKAKENLDYIVNRSGDVEVLQGEAEILDKDKYLTCYSFKANTLAENTIYELPYLYYPGYEVRYDGLRMPYYESENGMVAILMEPEKETHFELNYVGTKTMNISKIISIIGLCAFSIYVYKRR